MSIDLNERMDFANKLSAILRMAKRKNIRPRHVKNTGFYLEHMLLIQYLLYATKMNVEVVLSRKEARLVKTIIGALFLISSKTGGITNKLLNIFTTDCAHLNQLYGKNVLEHGMLDPFIFDIHKRFKEVMAIQGLDLMVVFERAPYTILNSDEINTLRHAAPYMYLNGKELRDYLVACKRAMKEINIRCR